MFRLSVECARASRDLLLAEMYDAGTSGVVEHELPEGGCRLEAFFDTEAQAHALAQRLSSWNTSVSPCEARDWVAFSQKQWEPELAGERFFLVPAWRSDPAPQGRLRLIMPPGTAAGTGLHIATQLALEGLERCTTPNTFVLDLGTGSGILAEAAALLGARRVAACDIEDDAVSAASEYLSEQCAPVSLFVGSLRSVRPAVVDLLVANINAQAIRYLASEIARVILPGGLAIVTGFQSDEAGQVERLLVTQGLLLRERIEKNDWACLICVKDASHG